MPAIGKATITCDWPRRHSKHGELTPYQVSNVSPDRELDLNVERAHRVAEELTQRQSVSGRARRIQLLLSEQGFLPSEQFVQQFVAILSSRGLRFEPRQFRRDFYAARHFQPANSSGGARIAVVRSIPILYRASDNCGNGVVIIRVLRPDSISSVRRVNPPAVIEPNDQAEGEAGSQRLIPPWELVTRPTTAPAESTSFGGYRGVTPAMRKWARGVYQRQLDVTNRNRAALGLPAVPALRVQVAHVTPLPFVRPGERVLVRPQEGRTNQSEGALIGQQAAARRSQGLFVRRRQH